MRPFVQHFAFHIDEKVGGHPDPCVEITMLVARCEAGIYDAETMAMAARAGSYCAHVSDEVHRRVFGPDYMDDPQRMISAHGSSERR